jgi:hypothetical protein
VIIQDSPATTGGQAISFTHFSDFVIVDTDLSLEFNFENGKAAILEDLDRPMIFLGV